MSTRQRRRRNTINIADLKIRDLAPHPQSLHAAGIGETLTDASLDTMAFRIVAKGCALGAGMTVGSGYAARRVRDHAILELISVHPAPRDPRDYRNHVWFDGLSILAEGSYRKLWHDEPESRFE